MQHYGAFHLGFHYFKDFRGFPEYKGSKYKINKSILIAPIYLGYSIRMKRLSVLIKMFLVGSIVANYKCLRISFPYRLHRSIKIF